MSNETNKSDPTPWYKQFWPWFLIALPSCVVVASMITINIAVSNAPVITDRNIGKFARDEVIEKQAE